jgi:uncharacterized metal-binding protein
MTGTRTLLALSFLLAAGTLDAALYATAPDEYLVDNAAVIVRAVVRPLERPPVREGLPRTHYRLEIEAGLRGAAAGELLEMIVPGGNDAAGRTALVSGAPSFRDGEEALLFLDRGADGLLRPYFLEQGVYRLGSVDGNRTAWRRLGAGAPNAAGETDEERPRELSRFETWVADRLAGRGRPADYFLEAPAGVMEADTAPFNIWIRGGLPTRWAKSTGRLDLTVLAHDRPQPGLPSGGYDEVRNALDAWTNLPDSLIRLRYGGTTGTTFGFRGDDGINAIVFDNHQLAKPDLQPFNCSAGLGFYGYAITWLAGTHGYAGEDYRTIVGADAVTNDGFECSPNFGSPSFEYTLTHELGHMLGLGHACDFDDPCDNADEQAAVMRNGNPNRNGARLSEDDRKAIAFLYGPPQAPDSLRAEPAGDSRVALQWEDRSDNESGFGIYRERNGQIERIGFAARDSTNFEDSGAEPGASYLYKVRAENENGASAAAEASFSVAEIASPAQLRAIEAGADFLRLAWVDRASAEQGFEVWGGFAGPGELLATLPANSTAALIDGLIADTVYHLKVRAIGLPSGNTDFSSTVTAGTMPAPAGPCEQSAAVSCLSGERFKVEVRWKDFAGNRGQGTLAPAGSADSGLFYFFSPNNWEMLVKVLDGCAINGKTWVFAAATTDVETTLIVTDSSTGKTAVYWNPLGRASPAVTDIAAFDGCAEGTTAQQIPAGAAPVCGDGSGNLCLLGGRYRVKVTWTDFVGQQGLGRAVPAGTGDSGLLYFFSPDNWEMLVKVLDGCAINGKVWVFAAATTNVAYTLEVEDTETGLAKTYENPLGKPSVAIADIVAFETCGGD